MLPHGVTREWSVCDEVRSAHEADRLVKWPEMICIGIVALAVSYGPANSAFSIFGETSSHLFIAIGGAFVLLLYVGWMRGCWLARPELLTIVLWLVWTIGTSMWCLTDHELRAQSPADEVFRFPIAGILLFSIFNGFVMRSAFRTVSAGLVIGTSALVGITLLTGQVSVATQAQSGDERLGGGILGNSNEYAYLFLLGVFAAVYLAYSSYTLRAKWLYLTYALICSAFIVLSGSRKAFGGEVVFLLLMFGRSQIDNVRHNGRKCVLGLAVVLFSVPLVAFSLRDTYLAYRLGEWWGSDARGGQPFEERFDGRGRFFVQAVELMDHYPVHGVGLGNFRCYDRYGYGAHSEYVAILTETGIPGFVLYFAMYGIVLSRLWRASRMVMDIRDHLLCRLLLAAWLSILFVALGRWNYHHLPTYACLGATGAYAGHIVLRSGSSISDSGFREAAGSRECTDAVSSW